MKVLEAGKNWGIERVCTGSGNGGGGCGAKLFVEIDDIYETSLSDLSGDTEYYFTFSCPCCGVESDIPFDKIPIGLHERIRTKNVNPKLLLRRSNEGR